MYYPILTSPGKNDPPSVRVAKLVQNIEVLVNIGETPCEIENEVNGVIPEIVEHFSSWARDRDMSEIADGLPLIAEGFIRYCYLVLYEEIYPKKVSLFRLGKSRDETFLDILSEDMAGTDPQITRHPEFRKINKMLLQYFRMYLKEIREVHKKIFEAILAERG